MDNDMSVSNDISRVDWAGYKEYLKITCIESTVKDRYNYSLKYCKYLLSLDTISSLMTFTPNKRLHIMKALSSLSKYLACSYDWQQAIKRQHLKWSTGNNSFEVFDKIVNHANFSDMLEWIKRVVQILPESHSNLIIFNTLVGLRPSESQSNISIA